MNTEPVEEVAKAIDQLHWRPGFLIRRANQIMVSSFMQAMEDLGITTTQYGALMIIDACGSIDQVGLARHLRLDRSTTGLAVMNLEREGLITRQGDPHDKRRRIVALTPRGRTLLKKAHVRGETSRAEAMAVFSGTEEEHFLDLLRKFVLAWDAHCPGEEQRPRSDRTEARRVASRSA